MLEGQGQGSEPNPPALLPYFLHDQYKCRITALFFFFWPFHFPSWKIKMRNKIKQVTLYCVNMHHSGAAHIIIQCCYEDGKCVLPEASSLLIQSIHIIAHIYFFPYVPGLSRCIRYSSMRKAVWQLSMTSCEPFFFLSFSVLTTTVVAETLIRSVVRVMICCRLCIITGTN